MSNNAFIVRPFICVWTARKMDKAATKEAREAAGATLKAGVKVYKSVIAAEALDKVQQIASAAPMEHRKRTVPWAYDGPGAITAEGYAAYADTMETYKVHFYHSVERFLAVYAEERNNAREYLGNMFNETDYPTIEALRSKFAFSISAEPMPSASAFDVQGLALEHVTAIKKGIAESNKSAMANANKAAWERVTQCVDMLKTRLNQYDNGTVSKFYDSWIDNISELAQLIPSINITGDVVLKDIAVQLKALTVHNADKLKENPALRSAIAKQAGALLEDIADVQKAQQAA